MWKSSIKIFKETFKIMKFKIQCAKKETPNDTWWEEYEKEIEDATAWGKEIIKSFNDTLYKGEQERIFIKAEVLDEDAIRDHSWEKSNLMTLEDSFGFYDAYKCKRCGITGKIRTLGNFPSIDKKYKAKVYFRCDTAKIHIEKRNKKNEI